VSTTLLTWLLLAGVPESLVDVQTLIPDAVVDLRYATTNNFMKKQVYPDGARCLLVPRSAQQLKRAAETLRAQGFRLVLFDCYRPKAVQFELWKIKPVPGYVADPTKGSHHSRGGAVDVGLVTVDGHDVEFPSSYDHFGKAAHHSFTNASKAALAHRELLRSAMESAGFKKNPMEWWHYDVPGASRWPLLDEPLSPR
jgi:D-alanyl-D-alanine dipeptidase